jgi:hypothetical protein
VADSSGYVPISQVRSRPGLHPDDLDYHHVAPIEAWDRDYGRWRSNTTRVQREFMTVPRRCLHIVPCVILAIRLRQLGQHRDYATGWSTQGLGFNSW